MCKCWKLMKCSTLSLCGNDDLCHIKFLYKSRREGRKVYIIRCSPLYTSSHYKKIKDVREERGMREIERIMKNKREI